ncbi:MAG: hypothetical protein KF873_13005 [Gemmataceae bacterium]|nr:hypothetical protein [Gemmataceae bacterium]
MPGSRFRSYRGISGVSPWLVPKPFKLFSTRPLSLNADILDHEGRPHVRLKERGRAVLYPLTKDGTKFLRASKCWYFKLRDANGIIRRVKGFTDLKATEQFAAESVRKAERRAAGITDAVDEQLRRPLTDYLSDYAAALRGKGSSAEHVRSTIALLSALYSGCGFVFPQDIDAAQTRSRSHLGEALA